MRTRMLKSMSLGVVSLLLFGGFAWAQSSIDQRERRQQRRIADGVRSGELTRQEVKKLEKQQARIHRQEARAKSDGEFTAKERARIQKKQNQASRQIYKEKHDNQDRN